MYPKRGFCRNYATSIRDLLCAGTILRDFIKKIQTQSREKISKPGFSVVKIPTRPLGVVRRFYVLRRKNVHNSTVTVMKP